MQDALPKQLPEPEIQAHPEEMKTSFNLRVGRSIFLQGSARITPAGLVTAGITACAMILACGYAARLGGRRGRPF